MVRRFFENRAGVPGQAELNILLKLASYPVRMPKSWINPIRCRVIFGKINSTAVAHGVTYTKVPLSWLMPLGPKIQTRISLQHYKNTILQGTWRLFRQVRWFADVSASESMFLNLTYSKSFNCLFQVCFKKWLFVQMCGWVLVPGARAWATGLGSRLFGLFGRFAILAGLFGPFGHFAILAIRALCYSDYFGVI